ncbi:hypothetical protein [Candidatus Palauibacter sp.]|uniref:hypothetical protein n=1 Tax=Candidatus Palauibacter sp. TaxID=3101350 RepID=UPI003C6F871F
MRSRRRGSNVRGIAAGLIALMALGPAAAAAQHRGAPFSDPPSRGGGARWELGALFAVMSPQGHFSALIDEGFGAGFYATLGFPDAPAFRVRFDAGYLNYGSETLGVPVFAATDRIMTDIVTRHNIGYLGLGPEIRLPYGPVQPYVNGFVGLGYFFTVSSVERWELFESFDSGTTVNFDDVRPAYGLGGGLAIRLNRSGNPLMLRLEAQYRRHGRTEYLVPGSIVEDGVGSTSFTPIASDADFMLFQVGVTLGL